MAETFRLELDGRVCEARVGETILQVANRESISIPTLCHDERLKPAGACRMCLVEVSGQRRLQPACAWLATPDTKIQTQTERVLRHQKMLLSLYLADHDLDTDGLPRERGEGNQLRDLAIAAQPMKLAPVARSRDARVDDKNPYIHFDSDLCILCARCTRYCDEVEAVNAIWLAGRKQA